MRRYGILIDMFEKKHKSKKDFLLELKEQAEKNLALIEVDIPMLEGLPDDEVVSKEQIAPGANREVKALEALLLKRKDLAAWTKRLDVINTILGNGA